MSDERRRWEERYAEGDWLPIDEPAVVVASAERLLPRSGLAWDVACGSGRHALFLARRGLRVIATDLSLEALLRVSARARVEALPVFPVHADLETWRPARGPRFDLIVNTYFLRRDLFVVYREALTPGGLLLFETYNVDEIETLGGDIRRTFALERGELRAAFEDLDILTYDEGVLETDEGERGLARMIARKPAGPGGA
ncbi:MAG: class I SAM-dependent methyltransferase [Gemmatimonadota bacterium]